MEAPLLVRACRREPVERTPVWFMRQAGRSLPEYRALRERHGFFELAGTPELCAEVTLQPVTRYGVDAAVLFADIMTPVLAMGVDVQLVEGVGPMVEHPFRTAADVERLRPDHAARGDAGGDSPDPRGAAARTKALVGFCGGPFTVACYLVEGRGSRDFLAAKELMHREPAVWHALLERLADGFAAYVQAQVDAGADVIQLFDSWAGILSPRRLRGVRRAVFDLACSRRSTFRRFTSEPARQGSSRRCATPAATSSGSTGGWSSTARGRQSAQTAAFRAISTRRCCSRPWTHVAEAARDVLRRADGRRGHVFNLGHGVLPQTDPDVLTRLTAFVQEHTS